MAEAVTLRKEHESKEVVRRVLRRWKRYNGLRSGTRPGFAEKLPVDPLVRAPFLAWKLAFFGLMLYGAIRGR